MRRICFYFSLLCILFLLSCTPPFSPTPLNPVLYIFRLDHPALVEFSADYQPVHEIPFSIPAGCQLNNIYPSPRGAYLAVELDCAFGQTVVWVNTDTGEVKQAYTESESHFLAWTSDGNAVYLKVDSTGSNPHIVRVGVSPSANANQEFVPITELTYDLSPKPDSAA